MASLKDIVDYCDQRTRRISVKDFPGSSNGLQLENSGEVKKIAASVDAGLDSFRKAVAESIDLLIVHHGLFWNTPSAYTGSLFAKLKLAMDNNLAVYSSHLPLDAHPEIGNNRLLADALGLSVQDWFLPFEGTPIACIASAPESRDRLKDQLQTLFPRCLALEFGSSHPQRIAILTGSGRSALKELKNNGTDTLITGELRQEHFTFAQEEGLNLYLCGHYATETFGVRALAKEVATRFNIPSSFIDTGCPL
jgi:dinuclear metal center YbgI/SA1388 family protein